MAPKKKKSGKKSKQGKKMKESDGIPEVDRIFYELTITDLNNKLSRLRSLIRNLEYNQDELNEKMSNLVQDRNDVAAYIQRQVTEKTGIIEGMNKKLLEIKKVRDEENQISEAMNKDWEKKYKAMNEQLTSEIKLLNGKLRSLEEYRLQRTNLLMQFDEKETELKKERQLQKAKLFEVEQKLVFQRDNIKKDVQAKLLELSDDFTKSNEIRIAGYTRRLIRENIALNNEMDRMMRSQLCMEQYNKTMINQFLQIKSLYANSIAIKERLIRTCENQINIIKNLTAQYEALQNKFHDIIRRKRLYDISLQKNICDTFIYNQMAKQIIIMRQRIENLKIDKTKLISMHHLHETEIIRLHNILKEIRFTVQSVIRGKLEKSDDMGFRAAQKEDFAVDLLRILTKYFDEITTKPSVTTISSISSLYKTDWIALTPKVKTSLFESFICKAKKIASEELYFPVVKSKDFESKITLQKVSLEREPLLDVESDSTVIFSLESGGEPLPPGDDALEEQEEYSTLSSAMSKESKSSEMELKHKRNKNEERDNDTVKVQKDEVTEKYKENKKDDNDNEEDDKEKKTKLHKVDTTSKISKDEQEDIARVSESSERRDADIESESSLENMTDVDEEFETDYFF